MNDDRRIDLLAGVLQRTTALIGAVEPDQRACPTPCSDYSVEDLLRHMVGWVEVFAAGSSEEPYTGDPEAAVVGDRPADTFGTAADRIVAGWRAHGLDREVRSYAGGMLPGRMVFGMTVMEYLAHGWDLATAIGADPGFDPAAAELALTAGREILLPEYRTPESFGPEVEVRADAPALTRFLAFTGRRVAEVGERT